MTDKFLSTPSARRATTSLAVDTSKYKISIHALREEGDNLPAVFKAFSKDFYPRPPRGGRRPPLQSIPRNTRFLSTPSARRATRSFDLSQPIIRISIHALREEGDSPAAMTRS